MNPILSGVLQLLPDRLYLDLQYFKNFHKFPNWKQPKTFNEKLQWMKLYDRKPEYTMMVDKHAVKDYVAGIIGSEHIIPTLGVWDKPEDIDWDILPDKFVLKTTHGGGNEGVILCKDKSSFDKAAAIEKLKRCLKRNTYLYGREWPYKNVPRRIIAEKFMEQEVTEKSEALIDYKFYCFSGEPRYCQVIQDRNVEETIDFYDMDWNHMPFVGLKSGVKNNKELLPKPTSLEGMINICKQLSKDLSFVRVDLYQVNDSEFFGEITFFPNNGLGTFTPDDWNSIMGSLINLPIGQNRGGYKCLINSDLSVSIKKEQQLDGINDYKFFCFDGHVEALFVATERQTREEPFFDFYDTSFKHLNIRQGHPNSPNPPTRPESFEEMLQIASTLSKGLPQARVDLYEVNGKVFFGEITFFHFGGVVPFNPSSIDEEWGRLIRN